MIFLIFLGCGFLYALYRAFRKRGRGIGRDVVEYVEEGYIKPEIKGLRETGSVYLGLADGLIRHWVWVVLVGLALFLTFVGLALWRDPCPPI